MKTLFVKFEDNNTDQVLVQRNGDAADIANGRDLMQWVLGTHLNAKLTVSWSWDGFNEGEAQRRMAGVAFYHKYSSQKITLEKIMKILND